MSVLAGREGGKENTRARKETKTETKTLASSRGALFKQNNNTLARQVVCLCLLVCVCVCVCVLLLLLLLYFLFQRFNARRQFLVFLQHFLIALSYLYKQVILRNKCCKSGANGKAYEALPQRGAPQSC